LLNVHKINKQDMQNTLCIIGVKLMLKGLSFTQIHAQRYLCHSSTASSITLWTKRCQTSIKRCFSSSTSWTC